MIKPPVGVGLFVCAFAILVAIGAMDVLPRFTESGDWVSAGALVVTGFLMGQTILGLLQGRRWAVIACAMFIVLIEVGMFLLGPPEKMVSVTIRTILWLALLTWMYNANRQYFR